MRNDFDVQKQADWLDHLTSETRQVGEDFAARPSAPLPSWTERQVSLSMQEAAKRRELRQSARYDLPAHYPRTRVVPAVTNRAGHVGISRSAFAWRHRFSLRRDQRDAVAGWVLFGILLCVWYCCLNGFPWGKPLVDEPGNPVVWVNTNTGNYHYQGSWYYENTKHGVHMNRSAADAAGYHFAANSH